LALANDSPERGTLLLTDKISYTISDLIATMELDQEAGEGIVAAFIELGLLTCEGNVLRITNFNKRNFTSDNSAERVREWRARQGDEEKEAPNDYEKGNGDETLQGGYGNGDVTLPDAEAKTEAETDSEKDAPTAGAKPPKPLTNLQDWLAVLRESKNRNAVLRQMFVALYPNHDPPDFGYLGKVARKVGGASRLADLLWHTSARPPNGDVLAYIQGIEKRRKEGKSATHQQGGGIIDKPPAQAVDPAQVERDRAALAAHRKQRAATGG